MDSQSPEALEWIKSIKTNEKASEESFAEKFVRKFKENPFIPIGMVATTTVLTMGLYNNVFSKDMQWSQLLMRYRVGFQAFTIMAFVVGGMLSSPNRNN